MDNETRKPVPLTKPDPGVLKGLSLPAGPSVQPEWIRERYPAYVGAHAAHDGLTSVRVAEHQGHAIRITTTYKFEVDGREIFPHAIVTNAGDLISHATPFASYSSAVDMVKALIERYSETFDEGDTGHPGGSGGHGGHAPGHGHAHEERGR